MKLIKSRQEKILFLFCPSPITIDKRKSWGDSPSNIQEGPDGAFLKINDDNTVSHLVQPNSDKSAPVGWVKSDLPNRFDKAPIWVGEKVNSGETVSVQTIDNPAPMTYTPTEVSYICYNDLDGAPNLVDGWIQKESALVKNYYFN